MCDTVRSRPPTSLVGSGGRGISRGGGGVGRRHSQVMLGANFAPCAVRAPWSLAQFGWSSSPISFGTGSYVVLEKRELHGTYGDSWESVARVTWKLPEGVKGSITGTPGLTS